MSKTLEMSRRSMIGATMMVPVAAQAGAKSKPGADKRPNFLFIFPDQFRFDWLSGTPDLPVKTPNLDAVAARGVRFQKAVVSAPVCAPSRACLASGREYDSCGVDSNMGVFPSTQATYYKKLRDSGYFVGACGKLDLSKPNFDNGLDGKNHMVEWGFSDMINCAGKGDAVFRWEEHHKPFEPYMVYMMKKGVGEMHAADLGLRGGGKGGEGNNAQGYAKVFPTPLDDEDYQDNWIGRCGLDLMKKFPAGKPWHLVVNFAGPHNPEDITRRMEATVRDRKCPAPNDSTELNADTHNAIRQNYTAMVENLDRWVGIFVEELKRRGEYENTIIVFSSDHGEMLGDHNRWAKNVPYEASIGVPLIVGGPGMKPRKSDALVSMIDISATFLDYAGAERPEGMTAKSFRPLLEGKTDKHRDYVQSGLFNWRLVADSRYKLVQGFDPAVRERGGSVAKGKELPVVLFDLALNPEETKNYAAAEPQVVERLTKLLPERNPDPGYGVVTPERQKNYGPKG